MHASLERELVATGLPWTVENAKKHQQVRLSGKLVAILPHQAAKHCGGRALKNTIAQVRRAARELKNGG